MIENTKYYSKKIGPLPKGCQYCVRGQKLVLFITGLCKKNCWYCPISDQKKNKDVIFANERPITNVKEAIEEAKLCNAKGAGITGGDPLKVLDRTIEYIKKLKKEFGNHFHIHLYTPLELVDKTTLQKLHKAGLDEIRFHPNLDDNKLWDKIKLANNFNWDVGIEIPVIPDKEQQTKALIDYIQDKVQFINLNELEIADAKHNKIVELGYSPKNDESYGVKGSEELAKKLLKHIEKTKLNAHYCTAKLKDAVQMAERIKRRAKNVAKYYDTITDEGTLIRAAIYLNNLKPSVGYRRKLESVDKKKILTRLTKLKENLNIKQLEIDEIKLRFLLSKKQLFKNLNKIFELKLVPAIVEEYPTYDGFEVEVEFIEKE